MQTEQLKERRFGDPHIAKLSRAHIIRSNTMVQIVNLITQARRNEELIFQIVQSQSQHKHESHSVCIDQS